MKKTVKKVIIYSMLGLLQVGLFASVTEAATKHSDSRPGYEQRYDKKQEQRKEEQRKKEERDRKIKAENERHKHEMKRRPHESDYAWQKRKQQEIKRHDNALREIQGHQDNRSYKIYK